MAVADNGKGFNEEEILPGEGLKNIRNRAALAGAQILINSNGYKGTKMILEVPL
jgi:signal transduction histidine kinase